MYFLGDTGFQSVRVVEPKYIVTDSGVQFTCSEFEAWCKSKQIDHRKGAVGQTGSVAIIERFFLTMKGFARVNFRWSH